MLEKRYDARLEKQQRRHKIMKKLIIARKKRAVRTRHNISGSLRPRLSVFRSNKYLYAQIIDKKGAKVIVSANSKQYEKVKKTEAAEKLGEDFAKLAISKKIKDVVFDKGSYRYHGRIKAFADAARKGGLNF